MTPESAVADTIDTVVDPPPQEMGANAETVPAIEDTIAAGDETTPDPADTTAPPTETGELPIHRGMCPDAFCAIGATYRPTASGDGFLVLEVFGCPPDTAFGAGAHGRPLCPNGHGELTIADDLLPAHEAITAAAGSVARATRQQPRLPLPSPPFNHEGAFHAIQEKRHEVKQLERVFDAADDRRKKAKAALDEGHTALGQLIDDLEEREQERIADMERQTARAADGHPNDTALVRCIFERQNDGQTCPLCVDGGPLFVRGKTIAPRDAVRHVEQVVEFLDQVEIESLAEQLQEIAGVRIDEKTVRSWTEDDRTAVRAYCAQLEADRTTPRPTILASAHVAATVGDAAAIQSCRECGAVLLQLIENGEPVSPYAPGTLVGTECASAVDVPHHYPKKTRGKKRARRAGMLPVTPEPRKQGATKTKKSGRRPRV